MQSIASAGPFWTDCAAWIGCRAVPGKRTAGKARKPRTKEPAARRRHREIVTLYYQRELSMKQIGAILQVHESRVSQLHSAAITRLRKVLAGNAVGSPRSEEHTPELQSRL